MRIILACAHLALIALFCGVAAAAAGFLTVPLLGPASFGVGPAAMGAAVLLLLMLVASLYLVVTLIIPVLVVLCLSLLFSITAGYRVTRWTRWLGAATNLCGCAYFLWFFGVGGDTLALTAILVAFSSLFILMPIQPNVKLTRPATGYGHLLLWGLSLAFGLFAVFRTSEGPSALLLIALLIFMALYFFPFFLCYKTTMAKQIEPKDPRKTFLISCLAIIATAIIAIPLATPLAFSLILMFGYLEAAYLHPVEPPLANSFKYWAVRLFGTFPPLSG